MTDKRRRERVAFDRAVECRIPALPADARILDVSVDGCRLRFANEFVEQGWSVSIEVSPRVWAKGEVVWTQGLTAGVRFVSPLNGSPAIALGLEEMTSVTVRREDSLRRAQEPRGFGKLFRSLGIKYR